MARHLLRQDLGEVGPVDGFDRVEQRHRFLDLVGLQRTDEVQAKVGEPGLERGIFRRGFLHAVLAEDALAGGERGGDGVLAVGLRNRDQGNPGRVSAGLTASRRDAPVHGGKIARDRVGLDHRPRLQDEACRVKPRRAGQRQQRFNDNSAGAGVGWRRPGRGEGRG